MTVRVGDRVLAPAIDPVGWSFRIRVGVAAGDGGALGDAGDDRSESYVAGAGRRSGSRGLAFGGGGSKVVRPVGATLQRAGSTLLSSPCWRQHAEARLKPALQGRSGTDGAFTDVTLRALWRTLQRALPGATDIDPNLGAGKRTLVLADSLYKIDTTSNTGRP